MPWWTLGLPPTTAVAWVDQLYDGLGYLNRVGAAIVGGDIVRSEVTFLTLSLLGSAPLRRPWQRGLLLRSAARPGDLIAVSGTLGGAAGGLLIRLGQRDALPELRAELLQAHDRPTPPVGLGAQLVALGVRAGIDLSDGLAADLEKLCVASGVGAEVVLDQLPVHPALRAAWPREATRLAVVGGEDYQLLVTCRPAVWQRVRAAGLPLTVIGRIRRQPGVRFLGAEGERFAGWDHFASPD
ncbi:MAG: hypothetical protein KatS3mg061_2216 [Dehalococcoidia bacterium]|nr:MAG: hypothetical protein KatS3mg061_2216 [Dehalococcoidia bacterium]